MVAADINLGSPLATVGTSSSIRLGLKPTTVISPWFLVHATSGFVQVMRHCSKGYTTAAVVISARLAGPSSYSSLLFNALVYPLSSSNTTILMELIQ